MHYTFELIVGQEKKLPLFVTVCVWFLYFDSLTMLFTNQNNNEIVIF